MSYRTEQEQIELFTRWWKENGRWILAVVIAGLLVYAGWTQWQSNQHERAETASVLYDDLLDFAETNSPEMQALALRLQEEYADTFYGRAALLFLAETAVNQGDLTGAESYLDQLINHNAKDDFGYTARYRSAKVLHASGKNDEALLRLQEPVPTSFTVLFAELRGDVYMTMNQQDKARTAYQEALSASQEDPSRQQDILEMKLSQTGSAL
jgi:predicted negative regulator of RcsB-dependent stress response